MDGALDVIAEHNINIIALEAALCEPDMNTLSRVCGCLFPGRPDHLDSTRKCIQYGPLWVEAILYPGRGIVLLVDGLTHVAMGGN